MSKKNEESNEVKTTVAAAPKQVKLSIKREHCQTPHSVELRKDENGIVIDARTEDHNHIYTIGAKTVENLFAESGVEIPANDADEFEIVFSPAGEIVVIQPKTESDDISGN